MTDPADSKFDQLTPTTPKADRTAPARITPIFWWSPRWVAYALAVVSTVATLLVSLKLPSLTGGAPVLMVFLVGIVLSAYIGGFGPGFTATVLAALFSNYFILLPFHSFHILQKSDGLRWSLLIAIGLLVSLMSEALHRSRRRAEESRRRYAVTLGSIGDAVITTDQQGRITLLNGEAERLTGWSNDEAAGQPLTAVFRIINENTRQPVEDPVKKVLRCGTVVGLANHTLLVARNGKETPIDDSAAPIKQASGEIIGVVLVFCDCTERKKAGDALALFRTLIDRTNDGIQVVDPATGRFLDVNETMCLNLGYTREEMLALNVSDIDPGITPPILEQMLKKLGETGSMIVEGVYRRKDGTTFPVEINKKLVQLDREYIVAVVRDISERRRMEEELRQKRALFEELVNSSPDGILFVDGQGRKIFQNPQSIELWKLPSHIAEQSDDATQLQHVLGSLKHPEQFMEKIRHLYAHPGETSHDEIEFKDGRFLGRNSAAVFDENKKYHGRIWTFRDITERKRAETALRESENLYRSLVSASPDAVTITDVAGRIEFVSTQALEIFGQSSKDELIGRSLFDWVAPEEHEKVQARLRELLATNRLPSSEIMLLKKDGTRFSGEINAAVLSSADGCPKGIIIITRDNTERKRVEDMQKRLATAVEQAAEDIIITDAAGQILYVNPAFETITGYSRETVIGSNPRILKSGKHDDAFYQKMWSVLNRGEVWSGHIINKRKDGTFFEEESTISPIRDSAGKIISYVGVRRDVTREVALETQLRQSQKMEAIGQLAGGIAHDFNNLLTAIRGNASLLLVNHELKTTEIAECSQQIVEAAERAASLTRQLLMFGRKQAIQPIRMDLNEVVAQMTKLLQRILGEDISLAANYAAGLPAIEADTGMIEQVLLNLAVNSRDAMPQGGQLMITTGTETLIPESAGSDPEVPAGLYVRLTVADTGCGISPENQRHIFEPFFTTKEVGKGTGLGLATVHGIVQQHNGWITVTSEINQGTMFRIYFPILAGPAAQHKTGSAASNLPRGTETILVVEDELIVRLAVSNMLQRFGYTVLPAATGMEALKVWHEHKDRIQLLLTDIVMPDGMTGYELARQLQADKPQLKIIYTSGYTGDLADKRLTLLEGVNFLQKPYAPQKLAEALRKKLDPS